MTTYSLSNVIEHNTDKNEAFFVVADMCPNKVRSIAKSPMVSVSLHSSVQEVTKKMASVRSGAAIVLRDKTVVGIFTLSDLVARVVSLKRCLENTKVADVMTSPVAVIAQRKEPGEPVSMFNHDYASYLPVVDEQGGLIAALSTIDRFRSYVSDLDWENEVLAAYVSADGIGG